MSEELAVPIETPRHRTLVSAKLSTKEIQFEPGSVGLIFQDGGKITHVEACSQAATSGVQPGWVMLSIADNPVSSELTHAEIGHFFHTANGKQAAYNVLFSIVSTPDVQTVEHVQVLDKLDKDLPVDYSSINGTTESLESLCRSLRDRQRMIDESMSGLDGLCNDLWRKSDPRLKIATNDPPQRVEAHPEALGYCVGLCSNSWQTNSKRRVPCKECTDIVSLKFAELERMIEREEELQRLFRMDRDQGFIKSYGADDVRAQCADEASAIDKLHHEIAKLKVSMAALPGDWDPCHSTEFCSVTSNTIAQTAGDLPEGSVKIGVVVPSGVNMNVAVGDEVLINGEFYRLKAVESGRVWVLAHGLVKPAPTGSAIEKLNIAPTTICQTQNFIDSVEALDMVAVTDATDKLCEREKCPSLKEPLQSLTAIERKTALLKLYLSDSLYCKVNKAIFNDSKELLTNCSGYIREFRDLFRVGHLCTVLETFDNRTAWRHCNIPNDVLHTYERGQLFNWSSFTSMSDMPGTAFGVCVIVQIDCSRCRKPSKDVFYPCHLREMSVLPNKSEIIWPPQCQFRFMNLLVIGNTITLEFETVEFPSVWELIHKEDWDNFAKWVAHNPDRVDTRARKFSIITTVAATITKAPDHDTPDPFATLVKNGASVNELDHISQDTPIIILAKRQSEFLNRGAWKDLTVVLSSLLHHGACMYMRNQAGVTAADLLPGFTAAPTVPFEQSHEATWQKFLSIELGPEKKKVEERKPGVEESSKNKESPEEREPEVEEGKPIVEEKIERSPEKVELKAETKPKHTAERVVDASSQRHEFEKIVLGCSCPRATSPRATTLQKMLPSALDVPWLSPKNKASVAGQWRPGFSQETKRSSLIEPLQAERLLQSPMPPPIERKTMPTHHQHRQLRHAATEPMRNLDFSFDASCAQKMMHQAPPILVSDRAANNECAGPVASCEDRLTLVCLEGVPEGAIPFQWAEGHADHRAVRRVDVGVWKVNARDLLNLLKQLAADAAALVGLYEVNGCAIAEISALEAQRRAGNVRLNEELAFQKVVPAHLANSMPSFVTIQGLTDLCAVAVRIRLNSAVATKKPVQNKNSGWGIPFFLMHLGPVPSTGIDANIATILSKLEEVANAPRDISASRIDIRACR